MWKVDLRPKCTQDKPCLIRLIQWISTPDGHSRRPNIQTNSSDLPLVAATGMPSNSHGNACRRSKWKCRIPPSVCSNFQRRAASSGWLVMWWFKLHSCDDDEVDTVAKERAERLQFYQIWDQRVGLSIEDLSQKPQNLNLIEPLSVTFPPRDFWSSTYCPPQSAAIKLYQYGLENAPWTRLISWGSINPAKYSWDVWKQ